MNNGPCIFIHKGTNNYLLYVLKITRHFNPSYRIILLGDETNRIVASQANVEFHDIKDYEHKIPYHHLSVNDLTYERFCFERWFTIYNFIKKHNINRFIHSDSDNAICYDINKFTIQSCAALGNKQIIVPNLILLDTHTLQLLTDYYLSIYTQSSDAIEKIIINYTNIINNKPHYSDMHFFRQAFDVLKINIALLPELDSDILFNPEFSKYEIECRDNHFFKKGTNQILFNIHFNSYYKRNVKEYFDKLM